MKNKNTTRIDNFVDQAKGRFLGFVVTDSTLKGKYIKFSGKVTNSTKHYITVKPFSGLCRGETKIHKNSIKRITGSNGCEYNNWNVKEMTKELHLS